MLSVDVVIPVYGHWELTDDVLASLAVRDACVRRVIVVDDASPDDTAQRLRERTDVVPLLLPANVGFARACNAGARAGDADAIFFLNNDTLVAPGAIDRLAATLAESGAAAVGPKIVHGDGTLQVAGLAMLARQTHFERLYVYLDADLPQAQAAYEPAALSGAALLIRRAAFDAVGGFEEAFVNGSEDVDLCLKLWAAGYRCRYEPRATIVHLEGASRGKSIDNAPNDVLLRQRWAARSAGVPRYAEPAAPVLDLRWRSATPLEHAVATCFRPALRHHAGARVVRSGAVVARIAAALDRRPRLSVEHRGSGRVADVVWCAPDDATAAAACAARAGARYWVPSQQSAALLAGAGIAADRISITRPGFGPAASGGPPPSRAAVVIRRARTPQAAIAAIVAALGEVAHETIVADDANAHDVATIAASPLVVFADRGDAWGLLGTAALAGGACTIARTGDAFLEIMPANSHVAIEHAADTADAVRAAVADPERSAETGARAARAMARRSPDLHAGRRVRELARAAVHGVPDPQSLTMPADAAAIFRAAAR